MIDKFIITDYENFIKFIITVHITAFGRLQYLHETRWVFSHGKCDLSQKNLASSCLCCHVSNTNKSD